MVWKAERQGYSVNEGDVGDGPDPSRLTRT